MEVKWVFLLIGLTAAVFIGSGILIGLYGIDSAPPPLRTPIDVQLLVDEVSTDKISSNLRHLTSVPHVAGTVRDREQAEWLRDRFLESGLDEAKTVSYEVLLSYPRSDGVVNRVSLIDGQGNVQFETVGRQTPLGSPEEFSDEVQVNFNAYSGSGVVEGDIVYAYYGRDEDYTYLASRNIDVTGKIVLVRYGALFRGSKVQIAERRGALGVILFTDPKEKAVQGRNFSYPESWWMPGMGVEMGTVYNGQGDPLTPFYPSIESAYRRKEADTPTLPKIPVQPIGYDEAEILLRNISPNNPAPRSWIGDLNATYNLGPGLINSNWKVRMNVSTTNQKKMTYNTIGILRGSIEDDRYVLLGNHRDSWTFGALDPSSGTASLVEIVRVFGKLKKDRNWRPRRTIVFCSWGAEEYGLIGSYEWMEQHFKVLSQRAVAYLNVDVAVGGNTTLYGKAFPLLRQLLIDMSKLIPNPNPQEVAAGRTKVFDTWLVNSPDPNNYSNPMIGNLGGGSDFLSFAYVVGMPCADFGYTAQYSYPTYHSLYDNYRLASEIVDRGFVHHQAVARMWAAVASQLADSTILPFDIRAYAIFLNRSLASLESSYGALLQQNNNSFGYFRAAVNHLSAAVESFHSNSLSKVDLRDSLAVRRVNDKLMNLERFFVDPKGLPDRPETNHIVFSISSSDSYASGTFAGLVDLFTKVGNQTEAQDSVTWAKIHQHLSVIAFLIDEAARSLSQDF